VSGDVSFDFPPIEECRAALLRVGASDPCTSLDRNIIDNLSILDRGTINMKIISLGMKVKMH
jgi:hypothetical protein